MKRILCITPNPAVDRTMIVPKLKSGEVHRSYEIVVDAGGKGINVARAVQVLGGQPICAGFLGGLSGQRVASLVASEGFESGWTQIAGETRTCVIVASRETGEATVFNENGPTVTEQEWTQLHQDILSGAATAEVVCLSGSLPANSPQDALPKLIQAVECSGKPMWVDTSGASLRAALTAKPTAIKVNTLEAGDIVGKAINSPQEAAQVAQEFLRRGIRQVAITLGGDGAILANAEGCWWVEPPRLQTVSAVGSGDCFLAGMVMAVVRSKPLEIALQHAVAAGSANTLSTGGGRFSRSEFEQILAETKLHQI